MSAGQIHDLGYKRYVGTRRSLGSRWTVIMRHQLATAWRGWWGFKIWFVSALMVTAIGAGVMYLATSKPVQALAGMGGRQVSFADGALALLLPWYGRIGMVVGVFLCSTVVAGDVQSGAFTFYFARSMRPRDYLIGKLAALTLLMALLMFVGPVLLAALRLGLCENADEVLQTLPILGKAAAVGVLGTMVYAAVPFGFSALIANRRYAMALWVAYYVVIGGMAAIAGIFVQPVLGALDLSTALSAVTLRLFEFRLLGRHAVDVPLGAALVSIFAHCAVAIAVVLWRVRNAQHAIGGSS
ncbi:MAG: hypothetical protein ABIY55_20655 [Kofleriaceae bacterium]